MLILQTGPITQANWVAASACFKSISSSLVKLLPADLTVALSVRSSYSLELHPVNLSATSRFSSAPKHLIWLLNQAGGEAIKSLWLPFQNSTDIFPVKCSAIAPLYSVSQPAQARQHQQEGPALLHLVHISSCSSFTCGQCAERNKGKLSPYASAYQQLLFLVWKAPKITLSQCRESSEVEGAVVWMAHLWHALSPPELKPWLSMLVLWEQNSSLPAEEEV